MLAEGEDDAKALRAAAARAMKGRGAGGATRGGGGYRGKRGGTVELYLATPKYSPFYKVSKHY